ncbi:UNVERIFIED_CONTAM: hypothetical protein K2H54_013343 [Gekko kuhli]
MDHPHGLTSCFLCRNCDSGSNLTIKERCTYTKNAVCSCASGYYCTHFTVEDCDSCQKHTVAQPGYKELKPPIPSMCLAHLAPFQQKRCPSLANYGPTAANREERRKKLEQQLPMQFAKKHP